MKHRYMRVGDDLEDDASVVVRGGELDREVLRGDAQRHHVVYGSFAISVLAVRDASLDELAQQPPLVRFERLTVTTAGALRRAGLRLEPTGRNPRHFSAAFDDLGDGVDRLCACEHQVLVNPYYEQ